jgi:acyl-CoA synthetase (AMP-forming)/AMP-acid ligase II
MELEGYVALIRRIVAQSEPTVFIAEARFSTALGDSTVGTRVLACEEIDGTAPATPTLCTDDDALFVQYTSGSTSEPRGCVLTAGAIVRQLRALDRALNIDPERDVGVVWLPLSHDMGLFGCLLLTYWTDHRLVLGTPERFLRRPNSWFEDCGRFEATIGAAPSFALDRAVRVAEAVKPPPFRMQRLVVGSDHVEANTLRRATSVLGAERLPRGALVPAYGLAEAVLAVTMTPVGEGPTTLHLDRRALERGQLETRPSEGTANSTVELVSAGQPLPGNDVKIMPGDAAVGEVVVSTSSAASGYLGAPDATAERFGPDGLRTRDLGFVHEGRLYVTGRSDDLIVVAGRNVYARDVEAALAAVPGLRAGGCSVIHAHEAGAPRLTAVVEPTANHADLGVMAGDIAAAALAGAGVTIEKCVFLEPGRLPKTPSGKVQRFRCRELVEAGPGPGAVVVTSPQDGA